MCWIDLEHTKDQIPRQGDPSSSQSILCAVKHGFYPDLFLLLATAFFHGLFACRAESLYIRIMRKGQLDSSHRSLAKFELPRFQLPLCCLQTVKERNDSFQLRGRKIEAST